MEKYPKDTIELLHMCGWTDEQIIAEPVNAEITWMLVDMDLRTYKLIVEDGKIVDNPRWPQIQAAYDAWQADKSPEKRKALEALQQFEIDRYEPVVKP